MNILVSNDDGIKARGLAELTKALSKKAACTSVLPIHREAPAVTPSA